MVREPRVWLRDELVTAMRASEPARRVREARAHPSRSIHDQNGMSSLGGALLLVLTAVPGAAQQPTMPALTMEEVIALSVEILDKQADSDRDARLEPSERVTRERRNLPFPGSGTRRYE